MALFFKIRKDKKDMNELKVFENEQFGEIRTVMISNEPWFVGKDVAKALGYSNTKDAIATHVDDDDRLVIQKSENTTLEIPNRGLTIINESGLYSLVLSSKLSSAKQFKRWVTSEVLPAIRKTGGYVNNDELFISTYFDDAPEEMKQIFRTNLAVLRHKNEIIAQQRKEIEHQEDVIVGLVEDIDLATKRQRINQIIRFRAKSTDALSKKWNLLYSEFEKKYHVNLSVRLKNYKDEFKPKLKNNLDVIDRQMHMIPQLYEVCCKLFENDVKVLMQEWKVAIVC